MSKTLHTKALVSLKKSVIDEEKGIISNVTGSTEVIDRMGEVIKQDGWKLDNYMKNPVILWGHNAGLGESRPPIGKALKVAIDGVRKKKLIFDIQFDLEDKFAKSIFRKFKNGYLNAFSVGFQPLEREDNTYTSMDLLELSAVPVPANPEALTHLKSKGFEVVKDFEALYKTSGDKAVVAFEETPTFPEAKEWDKSEAINRVKEWAKNDKGEMDWKKYRKAFAWYDKENPEDVKSYKFLHHDLEGEKLQTVWLAVANSMALLLNATGNSEIPEDDKKGVYNHLKKHYAQYDKEPPKYRDYSDLRETVVASLTSSKPVVKKKKVKKVKENKKKVEVNVAEPSMDELQDVLRILVTASSVALKRIKDSKREGVKDNER